ncbi:MAG TPA: hypothetical protein VMT14_00175 [Burkholderiaceae bacterium]|nr:hypothetical protein [Burkholderiaceae bacterium]
MRRPSPLRAVALATVLCIGLATPAHAALPIVAGLGKQLVQNLLLDGVKSQLLGSLSNMGCKGAAVASLLTPGGARQALLSQAMPGMSMPGLPGGADAAQMQALMQQAMAGRLPAGAAMSPEMMSQLGAAQQAMSQPLSRSETAAVFDELAELGVMTPAMQSELRDCLTLAPPNATAALGMSGALFKNMVLPQLRLAREQMANLQPEEREQLANDIVEAMKEASPEDRKAFQQGFGQGFFPREVVDAVKLKMR